MIRAGGTLFSLGVYSGKLAIPSESFAAGLGDHKIVTPLSPAGKEHMRRLRELVRHRRIVLTPLLSHTFLRNRILDAYTLVRDYEQRDDVLRVHIRPEPAYI
jgi:alcohol dehydrogenase